MATELYTDKAFVERACSASLVERLGVLRVDQAISAASREADDYLSQRFALPLVSWGDGLRIKVADIAVWRAMCAKGFNPEGDSVIEKNYDAAVKWLERVAAGTVNPGVTDSSPGAVEQPSAARASVSSAPSRGLDTISDGGGRGRRC